MDEHEFKRQRDNLWAAFYRYEIDSKQLSQGLDKLYAERGSSPSPMVGRG